MNKLPVDKPPLHKVAIGPSAIVLDEATINADIRARCPIGSPFFNWLTEIRLDDVSFIDEPGIAEGMRRLARMIQDIVLAEQTGK